MLYKRAAPISQKSLPPAYFKEVHSHVDGKGPQVATSCEEGMLGESQQETKTLTIPVFGSRFQPSEAFNDTVTLLTTAL